MTDFNYEVEKSTLGDSGHCGSANNCYYTGGSVCWVVINTLATGEFDREVVAVNRKFVAEKMAAFFNGSNYDLVGDPIGLFLRHLREIEDWDTFDKVKEV